MGQRSAATPATARVERLLRRGGTALLLAFTACCLLFLTPAIASGWIMHATSYGMSFRTYGIVMLVLCAGMVAAVICYLARQDLLAAGIGTAAYLPMLALTYHVVQIAQVNGWTGQTAANFGRNAYAVWRDGLLWNAVPFLLLLALSLTRWFSYENRVLRHQRVRDASKNKSFDK